MGSLWLSLPSRNISSSVVSWNECNWFTVVTRPWICGWFGCLCEHWSLSVIYINTVGHWYCGLALADIGWAWIDFDRSSFCFSFLSFRWLLSNVDQLMCIGSCYPMMGRAAAPPFYCAWIQMMSVIRQLRVGPDDVSDTSVRGMLVYFFKISITHASSVRL